MKHSDYSRSKKLLKLKESKMSEVKKNRRRFKGQLSRKRWNTLNRKD